MSYVTMAAVSLAVVIVVYNLYAMSRHKDQSGKASSSITWCTMVRVAICVVAVVEGLSAAAAWRVGVTPADIALTVGLIVPSLAVPKNRDYYMRV